MGSCGTPSEQSPFLTYGGLNDIEHVPSQPQFLPEAILSTPPQSESSHLDTHQYLASKSLDLLSRPRRSYAQAPYHDNDDLQSVTVYDEDKNAYMAETLAAPTYVPSEECGKDRSIEDSSPTSPPLLPGRPFSAVSKADMSPLEAFLNQGSDAPWNPLDLKQCDYCGDIFTKPIKKEDIDRHLKFQHGISNQDPVQMYKKYKQLFASRPNIIDCASEKTSSRIPVDSSRLQNVPWNDPRRLQYNTNFLLQRLNPGSHPGRVNNFFNGLDLIIGDLRERFPDDTLVSGISSAFARLEVLYQAKHGRGSKPLDQQAIAPTSPTKNATASNTECSPGAKGSANIVQGSSENDQSSAPNRSTPSRQFSDANEQSEQHTPTSTRKRRQKVSNKNRLLACPIEKHCKIHGRAPVCTFRGVDTMSEVTQHLKARVHRNQITFLALCRHCWEYTTSQARYHESHKDGQCGQRPQPRGARVTDHWLSLYRQICSDCSRIPRSPFVDCDEWQAVQPSNTVSHFPENPNGDGEPQLHDFTFDQSFLEVPQTGSNLPPLTPPSENLQNALPFEYLPRTNDLYHDQNGHLDHPAEAAAMELFASMFRDSFLRPGDLNDHFMDQLMVRASQMSPEELQTFSGRFRQRALFILHRLQLQSPLQPHVHPRFPLQIQRIQNQGSFPSNIEPTNHIDQFPFDDPANFDSIIRSIELDDLWLTYFPVPQEMLPIESQVPQHSAHWLDPQPDIFNTQFWESQIGSLDNGVGMSPGYSIYASNLMGVGAVPISHQPALLPQRIAPQSVRT